MSLLRRVPVADLAAVPRRPVDPSVLEAAAAIVEEVRDGGEVVLRSHAEELDGLAPGAPLTRGRADLRRAFDDLDAATRDLLVRVHGRIARFAEAQRALLSDLELHIEGGRAGHRWVPVETVGAYAPGGRYPLPSSVLMTVTPARVAGVTGVWLATPRPTPLIMAAAWVAGADGLVAAGGAHGIAALAFGTVSPPCHLIVGPGNAWVTAAKRHLVGEVGIDALAGPSEIVVIADDDADPARVAADLLAQAEHDPEALPVLVTTSERLADLVDERLAGQLTDLPTADTARAAIGNGFCVLVEDTSMAAEVADKLAPEHLALHVAAPEQLAARARHHGSVFIGDRSAEAFADYGAGPNHVLPTGGGARYTGGLSVHTFMRAVTWLDIDRPETLIEDTVHLARLEGLEAHARAALIRLASRTDFASE